MHNQIPRRAKSLCLYWFINVSELCQPGLYVRGDLGGNLTQSTGLKEFFGPVNPGSRVEFDPGVRFGVAVGYQFTDWFSLEGQTGFMANNISSITDATRLDAQYANVPFLANVRLQLPCHCRVTPYIGAGAGGSTTILDSSISSLMMLASMARLLILFSPGRRSAGFVTR